MLRRLPVPHSGILVVGLAAEAHFVDLREPALRIGISGIRRRLPDLQCDLRIGAVVEHVFAAAHLAFGDFQHLRLARSEIGDAGAQPPDRAGQQAIDKRIRVRGQPLLDRGTTLLLADGLARIELDRGRIDLSRIRPPLGPRKPQWVLRLRLV